VVKDGCISVNVYLHFSAITVIVRFDFDYIPARLRESRTVELRCCDVGQENTTRGKQVTDPSIKAYDIADRTELT